MSNTDLVFSLLKTLCVSSALMISIAADARTESWTENALLRDGKTIEVEREVEYVMTTSGEISELFKSWPTTYWLKFKHPKTGKIYKWQGEPHFEPVLLDFVDGIPYLVIYGKPKQSSVKKYGCPNIPYTFLKYHEQMKDWIPLQREEVPTELKDANLAPRYDGTYMPQNDNHPSLSIVAYMIRSTEQHSGGFFQAKVPLDFESWHYVGKQKYKNERSRDDCRPARQVPPEPALPLPLIATLEILEIKNFNPEWSMSRDEWSLLAFDKERSAFCSTLLKPADIDDPLMTGRYVFVNDSTRQKQITYKQFASPTLNTICDNSGVWYTDYRGQGGTVELTKYSSNGNLLYRLAFERPQELAGFGGAILKPTLKSANGYLFFEWWNSKDDREQRHVIRTLKVRLREPEPIANDIATRQVAPQVQSMSATKSNEFFPKKRTTEVKGFRDCATCPEMIPIPGKGFALGKFEVTEAEWKEVMGFYSGISPSADDLSKTPNIVSQPVVRVGLGDVEVYLRRLNERTGKSYRLPTETEWEYACYGGAQTKYCGGDNIDEVAWYRDNSSQKRQVGQKQANGYGLYDMSGNVWEWIDGCWKGNCKIGLIRGGSISDYAMNVKEAYRYGAFDSSFDTGFRIAISLQ